MAMRIVLKVRLHHFLLIRGTGFRYAWEMPSLCLPWTNLKQWENTFNRARAREGEKSNEETVCEMLGYKSPVVWTSFETAGFGWWSLQSIDRDYSGIHYVNHCLLIVELVQGCKVKIAVCLRRAISKPWKPFLEECIMCMWTHTTCAHYTKQML